MATNNAINADTNSFCKTANNLSDVTAATARTNLSLGTMATQAASAVAITGGSIITTPFSNNAITEATNARTLAIADAGAVINCTENTGNTIITIPLNATIAIPIGSQFFIECNAAAQLVTIALAGGVTLNGFTPTVGNTGIFTLIKIATNTWKCSSLYENTTAGSTFAWGAATSASQTIYLCRINNTVRVELDAFTVTSSQTSAMQSNTAIPARFRCTLAQTYQSDVTLSGGAKSTSRYVVDGSGLLYYQASNGTAFGAATSIVTEPAGYNYLVT